MLDGRLSLTTPEGVRLSLTPAGPGARALAWLVDGVIWVVCLWIMLVIMGMLSAVELAYGYRLKRLPASRSAHQGQAGPAAG